MASTRRVLTGLAAAITLGIGLTAQPATAHSSEPAPDDIIVDGHGWGHGRGMGQYGALGYAIDHGWDWTQILDHFYSNTTRTTIPNDDMRVRLISGDGKPVTVSAASGTVSAKAGSSTVATSSGAIKVTLASSGSFTVQTLSSCGGTVQSTATVSASQIDLTSSANRTVVDCGTPYAGTISLIDTAYGPRRVNSVPLETYLRGVVPSEMPSSWGDKGGGAGMNAVRVQAVAARSYSAAESRYGYADTCDTISCQVYKGLITSSNADQAIADTAGVVLETAAKSLARTEFSASTGGWTIGGDFPAVEDAGDDVSTNPYHDWTARIGRASIESKYGSGRTLADVDITGVMGIGPDGGHVTEVTIEFTNGTSTAVSADSFRRAFGLRSNWFRVSGDAPTPPGSTSTTTAPPSGATTTTTPAPEHNFTDIAGNVHADSIARIADQGISKGFGDGTFGPDKTITRAQLATFIVKAFPTAVGDAADAPTYSDVSGVHADSIARVAAAGISEDCGSGRFCPDDAVTRGDMASWLVRSIPHRPISGNDCGFNDTASSKHAHNICHAAADGIAQGYGDGTFRPSVAVSRAQMATFIVQAMAVQR